jgi:hypothetical protein
MELWLLHVSTPAKYAHFDNTNVSQKLESKNEPFLADFNLIPVRPQDIH